MQLAANPLLPVHRGVAQSISLHKAWTVPARWWLVYLCLEQGHTDSLHWEKPAASLHHRHHPVPPLLLRTMPPTLPMRCSSQKASQQSKLVLTSDNPAWRGDRQQRPSSSFFFAHFFLFILQLRLKMSPEANVLVPKSKS